MNIDIENRDTSRQIWLEVGFIVVLFFLYAGTPPPGVNEAHYLAKAKHYWDPTWCGEDVFLDSADPHIVFYWLFGWVTQFISLTNAAWLGRLITWSLLAVGWQRLSWALLPQRFASVAGAALFLVLVDRFHLAGEWVVGGVEAKSVSYALVLFGLRSMVMGRWRAVWLWLGGAAALHVLVGGWSVLAAGVCWSLSGKDRVPLVSLLPALIVGACLSLCGLVPALMLSAGIDSALVNEANVIYVFGRLPHHLVFRHFALLRMLSFGAMLVSWAALCWYLRDRPRWWRVNRFAVASLVISAVGVIIDLTTTAHGELAARLLRIYWFRLADVALPLAVALGVVVALHKLSPTYPKSARAAWIVVLAVPGAVLGLHFIQVQVDFRPGAVSQSRPASRRNAQRMQRRYDAWQDACQWIDQQTDPDSLFLTPRNQQTFKWYAGRAELACWKDIPQDAQGIVRWWKLMHEIYTPEVSISGLGSLSDEQLRRFADRYQIDYILVDRGRTNRRLGFHRIYPTPSAPNAYFEVYRMYRREQKSHQKSETRNQTNE